MRILITTPDEAVLDEHGNLCNEFKETLLERIKEPLRSFSPLEVEICCWGPKTIERVSLDEYFVSVVTGMSDWYKFIFGLKTGRQVIRACVERADMLVAIGPCRIGQYAAGICHAVGKLYTIKISEEYREVMDNYDGLAGAINYLLMVRKLRKLTTNALSIS